MDRAKIEQSIRLLLEGIGEDPAREGLLDTPRRVADFYEEIIATEPKDLSSIVGPIASDTHQEMVLVRDIAFHSLCEHHLLPFFGVAHVAYIPSKNGSITGISKIVRLVRTVAARLQLQERLTSTIADTLLRSLQPEGVLVLIQAEHLCMSMRGVHATGSRVVTSAVRGTFRSSAATRAEVLAMIEAPRT
ncbi:MAG: GTP cyclohydrolase I FolE [Actinobacteria bacterium RBG_16_64_13]|nr:MAG: GTP cyclohydrolase I FolE [Actinobacteria bacterium RBG_16_64_13]